MHSSIIYLNKKQEINAIKIYIFIYILYNGYIYPITYNKKWTSIP